MSFLGEIGKGIKVLRRSGRNALHGSFATAASFFRGRDDSRAVLYALLRYLFSCGGELSDRVEKVFRRVMDESAPAVNAEQVWQELESAPDCGKEECIRGLLGISAEKRERFFRFAAAMVHGRDGITEVAEKLESCARETGMDETAFQDILAEIARSAERRREMLRSGAGIIAAILVIAVFILTATLLRSVIFGLIAAYLLLPVEQYLEKNWRQKKGIGFYLGKLTSCFCWLPRKLASLVLRKDSENQPTSEQLAKKEEQKIIARAVGQTVFAVLVAITLLAGGVYMLSSYYLRGIGESLKSSAVQTVSASEVQNKEGVAKAAPRTIYPLQQLREKLSSVPFCKYLIDKAEASLRDKHTRSEITAMLWRRSGGVFSFFFNVMGFLGTLVCDLLLTFFFGMLFLMKMAEFKSSSGGSRTAYAVRTILVSRWLPNVSENTLTEAQRILSGVFSRLRIWVRGYLTLVVIDSTVYTVLFGILDLPYFPLLGVLAGCGILLPYVGPILSCGVTLLVTYLAGDPGVGQLIAVLCCYLVYNGVIEQFILYPMVIGESLGLTTLETIIVVLLGAIFAGIAGMILALPAASIIKYLVPQIYRCWDVIKEKDSAAKAQGA